MPSLTETLIDDALLRRLHRAGSPAPASLCALGVSGGPPCLQTQQRVASVRLIEALGGGWDAAQLPAPKQAPS